jgi:hypothetical protein
MEEKFIKKFWEEEQITFYIYFVNGIAIKQIEIAPDSKRFLSRAEWEHGGEMLYDGTFEELELDGTEGISKQEFEDVWATKP